MSDTLESVTDGVLEAIECFDDFDGVIYPGRVPGRLVLLDPDNEGWIITISKEERG